MFKNNKKEQSNPYHSGYKHHLVDDSFLDKKTLLIQSFFYNKYIKTKSKGLVCLYKIKSFNIKKNKEEKSVKINPYHQPTIKNDMFKDYLIYRINRNVWYLINAFINISMLSVLPIRLVFNKTLTIFTNYIKKRKTKKDKKSHFKTFITFDKKIREEEKIASSKLYFKKLLNKINKTKMLIAGILCSITGVVIAETNSNLITINDFVNSNKINTKIIIYPNNSIKGLAFKEDTPISIFHNSKENSNIDIFIPKNVKVNNKSSYTIYNKRLHSSSPGNYRLDISSKDNHWFKNFGIDSKKCEKSIIITNYKFFENTLPKFTIQKKGHNNVYSSTVLYENKNNKNFYYIRELMQGKTVNNYLCEVNDVQFLKNKVENMFSKI